MMYLRYTDETQPTLKNEVVDENGVHEERLNEILTSFFGDGDNDEVDFVWLIIMMIKKKINTKVILMIFTLMYPLSKQ